MECKKEFGKIMREERQKLGLTQEKLSELVGVSTVYYRELEHGTYDTTWVIWLKICLILHIDFAQIVDTYIRPQLEEAKENKD